MKRDEVSGMTDSRKEKYESDLRIMDEELQEASTSLGGESKLYGVLPVSKVQQEENLESEPVTSEKLEELKALNRILQKVTSQMLDMSEGLSGQNLPEEIQTEITQVLKDQYDQLIITRDNLEHIGSDIDLAGEIIKEGGETTQERGFQMAEIKKEMGDACKALQTALERLRTISLEPATFPIKSAKGSDGLSLSENEGPFSRN